MSAGPIADLLAGRVSPEAAAWLAGALEDVKQPDGLAPRWSGAGRRLGKGALVLSAAELQGLRGAPFVPQGWGADECGRALLLVTALAGRPAGEHVAVVEDLYRTGETRERQALLRVLAYLPDPARFTALAVDSVRANVLPELEAIACENPFPVRHFDELAFNQLVMKSLFNGISLRRIEGLVERRSAELRRMVSGYASERRAAGRPVPDDVGYVLDGGT
ncbi:MAG TPA: EboA domain-containing protein [Polyangia bacterium]|nr:EboA domain-containing protein [Polyangia bacterium]